ncbi:Bax inhibitor-1/YccA family protein [Alteraurantiacibacter aestuarii]|uniref:BAX inhibitor (BI)-1/YccA family protein n=1 Tax=Alteraurantiacibacter aestuarii TaxID=650004 RepID=A0A844ZMH3_9SPHN|nr:Bax inhibitor-1/YccA family protein [Alteraurantiacibacter aestuarii]MXO88968.1 BAX inhibitor (BI)-1/YccA family protein [Alteraurantiacibacter aestuarii]
MANWNDDRATRQGFGVSPSQTGDVAGRSTFDAGLRKHMLSIYNYMSSGVLLTGIVAMLFARGGDQSMAAQVFTTGGLLSWIIMLSPLAIVFAMSFGRNKFSTSTLQMMFWGFAVLMGLSLSSIFLVYTGGSIAATFFATAGAFAGLSLFGYTTKKDLSAMGSFLIMGVVGLIIASVINIFIGSTALELAISFLGVLIFAGLTAYDTQRLKSEYMQIQQLKVTNPGVAASYPLGKMVVLGALSLYLDFINMFLFLLRFMGASRN